MSYHQQQQHVVTYEWIVDQVCRIVFPETSHAFYMQKLTFGSGNSNDVVSDLQDDSDNETVVATSVTGLRDDSDGETGVDNSPQTVIEHLLIEVHKREDLIADLENQITNYDKEFQLLRDDNDSLNEYVQIQNDKIRFLQNNQRIDTSSTPELHRQLTEMRNMYEQQLRMERENFHKWKAEYDSLCKRYDELVIVNNDWTRIWQETQQEAVKYQEKAVMIDKLRSFLHQFFPNYSSHIW